MKAPASCYTAPGDTHRLQQGKHGDGAQTCSRSSRNGSLLCRLIGHPEPRYRAHLRALAPGRAGAAGLGRLAAAFFDGLDFLGVKLDPSMNSRGDDVISADQSRVTIRIIPTDEEIVIVRIVRSILRRKAGCLHDRGPLLITGFCELGEVPQRDCADLGR